MFVYASAVVGCAGASATLPSTSYPLPGAPAVIFAPGVVSTGIEFSSTFTRDGRTVYFTRLTPGKPFTVMESRFENGAWQPARPAAFSGQWRDMDPALTPDDNRVYFTSNHPVSGNAPDTIPRTGAPLDFDTWYSDRTSDGWSTPQRLPEPVNGGETDMYPSATRNGAVYFDSFRSRPRARLAYRAAPDASGSFTRVELLDTLTINADSGANNLFVDADERFVVFASSRTGTLGKSDLWISHNVNGRWTSPRNLGPLVNSADVEFCPFVSRDGKYLFFSRVTGVAPNLVRNIYVVRFEALNIGGLDSSNEELLRFESPSFPFTPGSEMLRMSDARPAEARLLSRGVCPLQVWRPDILSICKATSSVF